MEQKGFQMKITFTALDEYGWDIEPKPIPASSYMPKWFKDSTPYIKSPSNPEGSKLIVDNGWHNKSFKKCVPMLDAMATGYIITLWADVQIRQVNGFPRITWLIQDRAVFEAHDHNTSIPITPPGFSQTMFRYNNTWIPSTPKGYSCLLIQPMGHYDLPMYITPTVLDTDKVLMKLNPTVWIKEGFEGIIERGTPMFQLIPFKKDNWNSEFNFLQNGEYAKIQEKNVHTNLRGNYLMNIWNRKHYK